jgi:hypothetical protein
MPDFLPGLHLARAFYDEIVRPMLGDMSHSAARLGGGSDVLGFDTPLSTDHGWGPQLNVFVNGEDVEVTRGRFDERLPESFRGWPVRFGWDGLAVDHHVEVDSLDRWLTRRLGFDPRVAVTTIDWISTPQQLLLEVTSGELFHDGLGQLESARTALDWYPNEIWLWLLACQWRRVEQEEPFVGRAAAVGDELGSRLVAARLVRDLMRLCFLFERRYAPYTKWLGSAFELLDAGVEVGPPLRDVLNTNTYVGRERALAKAYEAVARQFNALRVAQPLDAGVRPFFDRPFLVLGAGRFADACLAEVHDPWLRSLPLIGGIDQFADSTDAVKPEVVHRLRSVYESPG